MNLIGFIGMWLFCALYLYVVLAIAWSSIRNDKRRSFEVAAVLALISVLISLIPMYIVL